MIPPFSVARQTKKSVPFIPIRCIQTEKTDLRLQVGFVVFLYFFSSPLALWVR